MMSLTDKENESYKEQKVCHINKKKFSDDKMRKVSLNYMIRLKIIVIILENLEELLIVFAISVTMYLKQFLL